MRLEISSEKSETHELVLIAVGDSWYHHFSVPKPLVIQHIVFVPKLL